MQTIKVILTGATGLVGEGVLMTCLHSDRVSEVLSISRRSIQMTHPKLKELVLPDFSELNRHAEILKDYDACFFCAGVSSLGMKEAAYTKAIHGLAMSFAHTLVEANPRIIFNYVSGSGTDSSERGKIMWARVKGRAENDLKKLPFAGQYNFRPAFMKPLSGQKNVRPYYRAIAAMSPVLGILFPGFICSLQQVGDAMIFVALRGFEKNILEVADIKQAAQSLSATA